MTWWGETELPIGDTRRWQLGPLTVLIERLEHEWRIGTARDDDPMRDDVELAVPVSQALLDEMKEVERYGASGAGAAIRFDPLLADRTVVARPDKPFLVPAQASVTIYVGMPVWLRISHGDAPGVLIKEVGINRPSDTWFGPTTEGELCYASRTFCRTRVQDLLRLPHRATTTVRITNRATTALAFERISLPAQRLALYWTGAERLWTESVDFTRTEDTEFAELSVRDGPPSMDPKARRLADPRSPHVNLVVRAFSSLIG